MAKKNKVLVDCGPIVDSNKSGVGYYTEALLRSLLDSNQDDLEYSGYYFNFLNRKNKRAIVHDEVNYKVVKLTPGKIVPLLKKIKKQPFIETFVKKKYDFILYTNYIALPSLRKTPYAVVIYDLSYIDHPEYVQEKNLNYLKDFAPKTISGASLIITISYFIKSRIEKAYPSTKGKIIVTHIPPDQKKVEKMALSDRLKEIGVKKSKYILYLGTVEPRKNIINLVASFKYIDKDYSLVIAGGKGWKDAEILDSIHKAKEDGQSIIQTGYVSKSEKAELYSNAAAFVLPSHYEGFGMPVLEAMQYGIPLAISDIPVFREVAGEAALYFDKDDPKDIARKISILIKDSAEAERLVYMYDSQLDKYSWSNNAMVVERAINKVVES